MTTQKSIRKTALQYGIIFSLLYFLLIFFSHTYVIEQLSNESRKHRLDKEVESLQAIIENEAPAPDEISSMIYRFQLLLEHALIVEMKDGSIIASSNIDQTKLRMVSEKPAGFVEIPPGADGLLGLKRDVRIDSPLSSITILEMESGLAERSVWAHLTLLAASALLLVVLMALVGATTYLALKPIGHIKDDMRRLQSGKQRRLNPNAPEEFSPLIKQFNNLLELASRRLDRHRRVNSDLSHMVKTSISANLAILSDTDSLPPSRDDIEFMISNLRDLSRSLNYRMSKADISGRQMGQTCLPIEIADNVISVMEKIFPDRSFRIKTSLPNEFSWPMERQDLSELLGNLLENGGKWSQTAVDVSISQTASGLTIKVADDGPGISPEAASKVVDRGSRLDETVPGFGLGLSIVSEILEDNFGQMDIGSSETGGARITVMLPFPE
ncbi:MAG: two-component system sensor histidine kinase PhoQ [Pseudomonadales bacterium]|jgi:two-component system sensor histidine kinase PhoQ|uniref:sensor histidine kinase n=1 Tax=Marinobacter maritimus TaxID=277961 RepID=UPI0011A585AB|nr:ATP-binding protein [Marinobacter maritimus]